MINFVDPPSNIAPSSGKEDAGRFRCTAANGFGIPPTKVVFVNVLPQNVNKEN